MDDVVCEEDEDDDEMKKRSDKVEWYTNVNLDHTQTELGALTTECRCLRLSFPPSESPAINDLFYSTLV